MDEDFRKLHENCTEDEAKYFMLDVSNKFNRELSDVVVDIYVLNIFDETYGFLTFINKTIDKKTYADAITEAIEIIYILIKNFVSKVEKYTPQVRSTCLKVILTSKSSAKEKRRALDLLQLIFENTNYYPDGYLSKEETFLKLYNSYEAATGEVLASIIKTLGILIRKYPLVINDPNKLYKSIISKLRLNINKTSESLVKECFSFVSDILQVYPEIPDEEVTSIYNYIRERMSVDSYHKASQREGLQLLTKHISLFSQYVYKDALYWQKVLNKWMEFRGDNIKAAYFTLDVIYLSIAQNITTHNEESKTLCMLFWQKFVEDIFHSNLHGYKLQSSIRGFGYFASAVKIFSTHAALNSTFYDFIHKIEKTYLMNFETKPKELDYLPDYIQTLSHILQQLDNITEYEIGVLQRISVLMIRLFPYLSHHHHDLVVKPLIIAYSHVRITKKAMAKQYLLSLIKEGIMYSCSHDVITGEDYDQNIITYKSYMSFWLNFVNKEEGAYLKFKITEETAIKIRTEIFDEFMANLFYLIDKLNLNTRATGDFLKLTDPMVTLQAIKVSDLNIFVNAVDLYVNILKIANKHYFKKWAQLYLNNNIRKSREHPLISGFYKLLAVGLKLCNDLDYFAKERLAREDIRLCFENVSDFINSVILKVKLYKDDLRISCIKVILSSPTSILSQILLQVAPIMVSLFNMGRSNLSLAEMGMDALESWCKETKLDESDVFLKQVLPCLDTYLCSKSTSDKFDSNVTIVRKTRLTMSHRKIVSISEGDLYKLQKRILSFIGGLSNSICRSFVENNDIIGDIVYHKNYHLKINLLFKDIKVNLYLEKLIPRIIELALYCSDRKLRINACEVLHAMVLVLLGITKNGTDSTAKDLDGTVKNITNALLLLGCNHDETVQKIIRPLVLQLMHWYSSRELKRANHTAIVMDTVFDGVTQTTDAAVRDFSCICIKEFVQWSIKQSSEQSLARDPVNIKFIIAKIRFFSSHSDPSKRSAAALIFNNLYTILREEPYLFEVFWIELLYCFVTNLTLIGDFDEYDSLAQVNACLDHLQRGFVEKADIFNTTHKDRKILPNFEDCLLTDVAFWLLKQTGSSNHHCREKCFSLFLNIAPLCKKGDLNKFIRHCESVRGENFIRDLYFRDKMLITDRITANSLLTWMSDFHSLLDAHIFFQEQRIDVQEAYISTLVEAADYFYNCIYPSNINDFSEKNGSFSFTPVDQDNYKTLKSVIIKKYIKYIIKNKTLRNNEHWNIFTKYIFENTNLLTEDVHVQDIKYFLEKMSPTLIDDFISYINQYLINNPLIDCHLNSIIPFKQRQLLKGLLILCKSGLFGKLDLKIYIKNSLENLLKKITNNDGVAVNLQDSIKEYCQLKIDLCLRNGSFPVMINALCDNTMIMTPYYRDQIDFGRYLFDCFKTEIVTYLVSHFHEFLEILISKEKTNLLHFIEEILLYLSANKQKFCKKEVTEIIEKICSSWILFEEFYDENVDRRIRGLIILSKLAYLLDEEIEINTTNISQPHLWLVDCLDFTKFSLFPHKKFEFLNNCIIALPMFLRDQEQNVSSIRTKLTEVEENCFTNVHEDLKAAVTLSINKLFQIAIQCKSNVLFIFASKFFILNKAEEETNTNMFCKVFMRNLSQNLQLQLLRHIYNICTDYTKYDLKFHYNFTKDILLDLLRYTDYNIFEEFYVDHIKQIIFVIQKKTTNHVEIVEKSIGFMLLSILFSRIDIDKFEDLSCPITKSAFTDVKTGRELARTATGVISQLLKENPIDNEYKEWDRICKCECYNAFVSVTCNMKKAMTFCDLLFRREVNGVNMLWQNIIDNSKDYSFPVDFDEAAKRRKNLVAIRSTYRKKRSDAGTDSLRYIDSQNILNSTLCEEITKYDLSRTILRSQPYDIEGTNNVIEMQVDIDGDELNSHECMATLCGLFQHLCDEEINTTTGAKIPDFIKYLKKDLEDSARHIKLFLIKAIENKQEVFKPYANALIPPIMNAIVDGIAGTNINYFVADLIVMLVFWSNEAEALEYTDSATAVLDFLIRNVNRDRVDIRKYHIDLIKFFVENWKNHIKVPKDYLLSELIRIGQSKTVLPIIHISFIFLANNLEPWEDVKVFVKKLIEILSSKELDVYRSSAEAIGTALSYIKGNGKANELKGFETYLVKKLKQIEQADVGKCLVCLQAMMKHYPEICDSFIHILISRYARISGKYKGICLKIFLERIDTFHNCPDIQTLQLEDLISDSNEQFTIIGLEIIRKTLPLIHFSDFGSANSNSKYPIKKNVFMSVLRKLSEIVNGENNVCRSIMFDIFMDIYRSNLFDGHADIISMSKDILLDGLVDHNSEIEEKIFNFWRSLLPENTLGKFLFILKDMYKINTENHFLGYHVNLLLDELSLLEEYNEAIFTYNLADCIFTEYQIKDNWRERHNTLAPMFAQSYRSQSFNTAFSDATSYNNPQLLRATNIDMEFEPTVRPSLLDNEKLEAINTFIDVEEQMDTEGVFKVPLPVKLSKKRFDKDPTKSDRRFALREMAKRTKVEKERQDKNKQRQQEANIYRNYKHGDFPDIKISNCDIIIPLKILVKHDNQTARILYGILFQSIANKEKDNEDFINKTAEGVNNIFKNSLLHDVNVVGALLDVAMNHKNLITFTPEVICRISINSGLLSSGALLLEEYLMTQFDYDEHPTTKQRKGYSDKPEDECWTKLADLYKELEEWDLVQAIFLNKMCCHDTAIKAIEAESQSFWRDARHCYEKILFEDSSSERRFFYYESYYRCLAELSDWSSLSTSIQKTLADNYWEELWDQGWNQHKLLPWFITSELRNILISKDTKNKFLNQMNSSMLDTSRLAYIKQNFSEEIAFLYFLSGNFDKVQYFIISNMEVFLSNWASLNPLLTSLKIKKLTKMQNSLEIYNFITRFPQLSKINNTGMINNMCDGWLQTHKETLSSIVSNETKNVYKTQCLNILQSKYTSENVQERLTKVKFQLDMNLVNMAIDMKNFDVARKYIKANQSHFHTNTKEGIKHTIAYSKVLHLKGLGECPENRINNCIITACSYLYECLKTDILSADLPLYLSTKLFVFELMQELKSIMEDNNLTLSTETENKINKITNLSDYTSESIANYGYGILEDTLKNCINRIDEKNEQTLKIIGDAYFKLATFVQHDFSRRSEWIIHILRAMFYESSQARQVFPCLLQMEDLGTTHKDSFLEEVLKLPEWMFIQWIPQLLANLDTSNIYAIFPIVENIAKKYPQALIYCYQLSKQKYVFHDPNVRSYSEQVLNRLDELLNDTLAHKFLAALSSVSLSSNVIIYYINCLRKASDVSSDKFKQRLHELRKLSEEHINYRDTTSFKGPVFKEIISCIKGDLLPLEKKKFNLKDIKLYLDKLYKMYLDKKKNIKNTGNLSQLKLSTYSPWMVYFSDNEVNTYLEIPGQYRGDKKPLLQHHAKICGFSPELSQFDSLRSPLKLTIIGSDAKEYLFLVKYGEDLRQDQRIEQLFSLMNNILDSDPVCREKKLNIHTYQVIPLTDALGLIECVPNSITFQEFLKDTVPQYNSDNEKIKLQFYKRYLPNGDYMKALFRHSPDSAVAIFRQLVNCMPYDMFRKAIWSLSVDAESFVVLRHRFITSHAVTSVANWILGIGDRHLANSLISLRTGRTIDVDFGHAFGSSVQILPVPEVVPFRLTPHIVDLMQPLKEHGLIERTMIHTLLALRKQSFSLLSTMNIFIKEPSLEWMEFSLNENENKTGFKWNPEKKLEHCKRKLNGASSVEIMLEELSDKTGMEQKIIDIYKEYVKGDVKSIRAKHQGNLSVEDQVSCLLEHATDSNLLCRLYVGFEAWI